jgi:hypothetical protein
MVLAARRETTPPERWFQRILRRRFWDLATRKPLAFAAIA